ncbi:hypothetical protein G6F56_002000 [Rhizopus delemar]|nr:hypothetical protein G6F56_002000 [Rhizopus delemar]
MSGPSFAWQSFGSNQEHSLENDQGKPNTLETVFKNNCRLSNGRKTRWDVENKSDDASSLDSLQSDDDVLGPWIELGMIDCKTCIANTENRFPLDSVGACSACAHQWRDLLGDLIGKLQAHPIKKHKKNTSGSTGAFMPKKTIENLGDPHGFYPNPHGHVHNQVVEVLNIGGIYCRGQLEKMQKGKVLVKYGDHQEEWVIMGSRRLRVVSLEVLAKEKDEENQQKNPVLIPRAKPSKKDDYVSSTLDKDPQQLFNDNEVFMTRRMARTLVDEYGFRPNSFGYRRNRPVAVIFNIKDKECIGYLREMKNDRVSVWYPNLEQSEWIIMGSRRLRLLTSEEEITYAEEIKAIEEEDRKKIAVTLKTVQKESKQKTVKEIKPKKGRGRPKKVKELPVIEQPSLPEMSLSEEELSELDDEMSGLEEIPAPAKTNRTKKTLVEPKDPQPMSFLTTGAFATRRAMRQLQDENGFVPNPYNYTFNQPVEVLNTRSGKIQFWECGRLVAMRQGQVKVHYDGWDTAYDEWIMLGSRRIRLTSESNKDALLATELNPELNDKHRRKHQVVRPEDYQKLGLLEKEKKRKKLIQQKKKKAIVESVKVPVEEVKRVDGKHAEEKRAEEKQIISLRVAQAKAIESYAFVANVYGYDYMQHVTVLHLDKKLYEGRLISMHKNKVRVHYCGWPDSFDEEITVGSRRIQPIENDHQVECIEKEYRERYETQGHIEPCQHIPVPKKINRKRLTLEDVEQEEIEANEYYKEDEEEEVEVVEMESWKVYCNQCNIVIKQFRYYCTYCENPSVGYDYRSFELCLRCFDQNFPFWHEHPRSSFAIQAVIDAEMGPRPIKGELVTVWEEDILEEEQQQEETNASDVFTGDIPIDSDQGYKFLKRWKRRKVCAFCNDDDDTSEDLGQFIGPFVIATYNKNGLEKKRSFWAHDACARYSPEVFCTPEGKWYNVTLALRRGRGMVCVFDISFDTDCLALPCFFHLPCSKKPVSYFKSGVIFWCGIHEAKYNKKDAYVNIFNCDGCGKKMEKESWLTCVPCSSSDYFSSFDLCTECYEQFPSHPHTKDEFEETSLAILKEMEAQKTREIARKKAETREANAKKKKKSLFPRKRKLPDGSTPISCCYCGTSEAESWRKGYDGGVMMCNPCFELALMIDNDERPSSDMPLVIHNAEQQYMTSIEDYSHKPYFTRDTATKVNNDLVVQRLASYEPQPNQIFSLTFDSTYFDIPGRAPRWATHSGTDYHDERVLSNFLGRGTDAIECFLLQRRCIGVDINPAAISLSQRNCCFEVPPGLTSAEYRPIIAQADSRQLTGALFTDESFHHILSHPPYKDCVTYSTHLDGDLSRFTSVEEFNKELLKMSRRLTLGIGDNREHCFYIPVGYHMFRIYIDQGFELEELVAFGLGTYLCVQFDFLVFTHEFITTFRKIPKENIDRMLIKQGPPLPTRRTMRGVPSSAIMRKSVVMGTVWVFKPTESFRFDQLCISRMVERFGKDDGNWEHIELDSMDQHPKEQPINKAAMQEDETLEEEDPMSEYEKERLKRIEENNNMLLKLGLISELSEKSDDVIHYETMMNKPCYPTSDLVLMIIGHQQVVPEAINAYRQTLVGIAREATERLVPKGMLIIGTQDVREPSGKLWPISMLVLEDIENELGRDGIRLKELVVTVPDGYSKDRQQKLITEDDEEIDIETVDDFVPIVHAVYLIFQRL